MGDMETYYGNGHAGGHGEGFRLEIRWGTWLGLAGGLEHVNLIL